MKPGTPAHRLMRMKNAWRAAAGLVLALAVAGCGTTTTPQPGPVVARGMAIREPLADPRPYGAADTAFGLDMLGAWCRADPQSNLVLSPSSLASGLGMAYLGARAGTAQAMTGVLHLPTARGAALMAGLQARSAALRRLDGPGVTADTSDQVWADPSLTTLPGYRGGQVAMMALLPPASADGCVLPTANQLGTLASELRGAAGTRDVTLPRVNLQDKTSMMGLLAGLGMGVAFTSAADFTGLSPQACCIGLVKQAATLRVGEQGTVASGGGPCRPPALIRPAGDGSWAAG